MTDPVPAAEYHERTKHSPRSVREEGFRLDWDNKPIPYKIYEDLPAVALPDELRPPQVPALRAVADPGPPFADGRRPDAGDSRSDAADRSPDADNRRPSASDRRPDAADLAALCYYAAGVTKTIRRQGREVAFRAAACTGALYHVDLYLATGDLDGLPAGVYHFDPRTLSLDVLREGDYRGVLAAASGDEPAVAAAPVTVVATSTWWRNAWKYRARTYRHAFWDSGTVLANLLAVASALDLPARVATGFADGAVADLLGVDPAEEGPLELVAVGRADAPVSDPPAVEPIDPATRPLSPDPVHYDLVEGAYAASSLPDGGAAREWRERRPGGAVGAAPPGDGERVALDPAGDERVAKTPLHWTIRRRGSCRAYAREPLSGRKVSTVLDRAVRGARLDVRGGDAPALQYVDAYCIVHAVEGVPPGVYQYHPEAGELERLRAGEFRREAGHLALDQSLAADAALNVYFVADLDAVTGALGDRGYRVAQLEAALAAGRLYLAAYAHRDLGATGLTFYDDAVTDFLSPRAADATPMFLWTLGRPA